MPRIFRFLSLLLIFISVLAPAIWAAETPWTEASQSRARFLTGTLHEKTLQGALEIELSPGWHTYWKISGDAGLPPEFDWSASRNVEKVDVSWPSPERFSEAGLVTMGYKDSFILPLEVALKDPSQGTELGLKLQLMLCNQICIPETIALSVPVSGADENQQKRIDFARRKVPGKENPALKINTVAASGTSLAFSVFSNGGFDDIGIIASAGGRVFTAIPGIKIDSADARTAMVTIEKPADIPDLGAFLSGKELEIVLISGSQAVQKTIQF